MNVYMYMDGEQLFEYSIKKEQKNSEPGHAPMERAGSIGWLVLVVLAHGTASVGWVPPKGRVSWKEDVLFELIKFCFETSHGVGPHLHPWVCCV